MSLDHIPDELEVRLAQLEEEHRDLDHAIHALIHQGVHDQLKVMRLKKRKLALKDQITAIHSRIIPDDIA